MKKYLSFLLLSCLTFLMAQTAPPNTRLFQPTNTYGVFSKSFIKHLYLSQSEIFMTVYNEGGGSYLGQQITDSNPRFISRVGQDGIPKWTAKFLGETSNNYDFNINNSIVAVDSNDNMILTVPTSGPQSTIIDAAGNTEVISNDDPSVVQRIIFKLDKDGHKIWTKKINHVSKASVVIDNNNDVYIVGLGLSNSAIDGFPVNNTFIAKINGNSGNVIFTKSFDYISYQFIPVFDNQNTMYAFTEPMETFGQDFNFDNIIIPANSNYLNSLMLKMDGSGNVIWGKNFYTNLTVESYSWMNNALFDGTDFVITGNLIKDTSSGPNFLGLDGVNIPAVYGSQGSAGLIGKIDLGGNVIWQKAIFSSNSSYVGFYTNINLDENKNFYTDLVLKDKVSINGSEYTLDPVNGNKVILKFDTGGNLQYFNPVDTGLADVFNSRKIDVIANDQFNLSGITSASNFLGYQLNNASASKFYVATFGNLSSKYLIPEDNYLQVNNVEISNNPNNENEFSFNLINNVNWTATSDQNWLTLSYLKLAQKGSPANTISDNGDARITLNAETNNTGTSRTANVLISGDQGVSSKTIIVTQTYTLGTNEPRTFITTLYPNPTSDILNIQTEEKISKIEIYDVSGKLLKSMDGRNKNISVSSLNKGMYLIKLYTENGVLNSKFIKN